MKFTKKEKIARPARLKAGKKVSLGLIRGVFIGIFLFLMISGPLAFFKANQMQGKLKQEQADLTEEIQKMTKDSPNVAAPSELYKQFLAPFIELYVTIPAEQQAFEKKQEILQKTYYSFQQIDEKNSGSERKLLTTDFYNLTTIDGATIATYRISYELTIPVTKEREVKKKEGNKEVVQKEKYTDYEKQEKKVLLNIPFKEYPDGTFKVTSYPYFSNEQALTAGKLIENGIDKSEYTPLDTKQDKKVKSFVTDFLEKYATSKKADMVYFMKTPEVLTGNYLITDSEIENFQQNKQIIVLVTFDVKDKDTKVIHKEQMTLCLKQRDSTYYIEECSHVLGGK